MAKCTVNEIIIKSFYYSEDTYIKIIALNTKQFYKITITLIYKLENIIKRNLIIFKLKL